MAWTYVGRLGNSSEAPPILEFTAGTGGTTIGMPVVFSSGTVITKTGGTDTTEVLGIPIGTVDAAEKIGVILALQDVVFEAEASAALTVGVKYGIVATTLLIDAANTTQVHVLCLGAGSQSGWYRFVVLGFGD